MTQPRTAIIGDPRLDRLAGMESYAEIRVRGLDAPATDVLLEWLPPFFLCRLDDRERPAARSWTVEVSTQDRVSSPSIPMRDDGGVVRLAAHADPARRAGAVVGFARAVFKALTVELSGVNLHAAGIVRDGAAVLLTGERHAGKTTVMLAALASGSFDFLANDQVMIVTAPDKPTTSWGYPALIKVRAGSQVPLDLGEPLYRQADDGPMPASEPSTLHLPAAVARSFGVAVVSTGRPVFGIVYEQSDRDSELAVREDDESARRWDETSHFPMREAYPRPLMDVVQDLVGSSLHRTRPARARPLRRLSVLCGRDRIDDFVRQLAAMTDDGGP